MSMSQPNVSKEEEDKNSFLPFYLRTDLKHNRAQIKKQPQFQRRRRKSVTDVIIDYHRNHAQNSGEVLSEMEILNKVEQTKSMLTNVVTDDQEHKIPSLPSLLNSMSNDESRVTSPPLTVYPPTNSPTQDPKSGFSIQNFHKARAIQLESPSTTPNSLSPYTSPRVFTSSPTQSPRPPTMSVPKINTRPMLEQLPPLKFPDLYSPRLHDVVASPKNSRPQSPRSFVEIPKRERSVSMKIHTRTQSEALSPIMSPLFSTSHSTDYSSHENSPRSGRNSARDESPRWRPKVTNRHEPYGVKKVFGNKIDELINQDSESVPERLQTTPIFVVGFDGEIISANEAMCTMLGYEKGELDKKPIKEVAFDGHHAYGELLYHNLLEKEALNIQQRFLHFSGDVLDTIQTVKLTRNEVFHKSYFVCNVISVNRSPRSVEMMIDRLTLYDK